MPSSDDVLAGLRAFQRATATYAFSRLYDPEHPSLRFLVADEVGLGKTLVARGLIAQVIEHLYSIGDKRIDIVYICSNGAIARQNLRKLNIAGDEAITEADRFTMLANEVHRLEGQHINLIAVTPGTSLEFGSSAGKFQERALIYAALQQVWGDDAMRGSGAERVFYLGITDKRGARRRLRDSAAAMAPADSVIRAFELEIGKINERRRREGQPSLQDAFERLAKAFTYKDGASQNDRDQRNRFVAELRMALAVVGIEALQPDLVILDEFQRFRNLLDPANQSWAALLARALFDYRDPESGRPTRTLMLSATPYRPYSTADDTDGDSHFADFVQTAQFLFGNEREADALRLDLRNLRRSLLSIDRDGGDAAVLACQRVAGRLRPVMARTERLASTPDRNGMLEPVPMPVKLERHDVDGYLAAAGAAEMLDSRDIIEFWKSGPYLLNFMEGYKLKNAFDEAAGDGYEIPGLRDLVANGRGLLNWDDVSAYAYVDPANARLRALAADTIGRDLWKLLWLPPSLTYYRSDSIFDRAEARTFTKRLVFSAWHLVPKVISAMLSYEAERHIFEMAADDGNRPYDAYSLRPDRRLNFAIRAERPASMPVLNLVVPYVELARLADPLAIASGIRASGQEPTRSAVEQQARALITKAVEPLTRGSRTDGPVDQRWYWAAPLLLDHAADPDGTLKWWSEKAVPQTWTNDAVEDDTSTGFRRHLVAAKDYLKPLDQQSLARVPDDLVEVIAATALGSPAICALRSLSRVSGHEVSRDSQLMAGAARISWGFRALFNAPDATAVIRSTTATDAFWRAALDYAIDGHIQATLDEYIHVLKDWRGFLATSSTRIVADLADTAYNALSLQTVNYAVDIPVADNTRIRVDRHTMRGRFAIRFGDQSIEGEKRQQRAQQASQAFNSPFWPFVLTTTSIGQEGLDFHLYSHAVVHWNIPSNPVDFEQREGRVHRYKGHAIRKNVAAVHGAAAFEKPGGDPWEAMFAAAASSCADGDISPYWVFNEAGASARIERYVPVLPLSSDASKLARLLKDVAAYRLSFGQPRQEELLNFLEGRIPAAELEAIVQRIRVDLTPPEPTASSFEGASYEVKNRDPDVAPDVPNQAVALEPNDPIAT